MMLDTLQARMALSFGDDQEDGDYILNPFARDALRGQNLRDAAVLIPIVQHVGAPSVIFTLRSANLRKHTGQIAFPGGAIDAGDVNAVDAALRETEEEIGLPRNIPQVVGQLPDYISGSGFRIKPVVALVPSHHQLKINTDEVEEAFEVPLAFLMNPQNHIRASREWQGVERFYYEMPYERHRIWGVTAGIIRAFYERVFA
jgi:8-oxo-dGTP pyrophosphatase MutT (NUDIX family)